MDYENEQVCNFCGRFDENFNQESIDIHYWKECPMLTTCWECEQVVEVSTLNEHLIEECQNSDKYKECTKCVTVLLKEDYPGHYCLKPKPSNAAKCPLCTSIIYPVNIQGWREHLMQDGCSGSNRLQPV
jgi:centrosomal protein CEP104